MTRKQKQVSRNMRQIAAAFYDRNNTKRSRTWNDLINKTGLSKGALSKHLKTLVIQGSVKGIVRVYRNRLTIFYEYTGKPFSLKGKIPSGERPGGVFRMWLNDNGIIIEGEFGYMKKGKHDSRYFAAEK